MNTNLDEIKKIAIMFLYQEPEEVPELFFFVVHPFLETRTALTKNGKLFDIFEDKESYKLWLKDTTEVIRSRKSIEGVFGMIRKSYRLTFFKYIESYLNENDFARILHIAWVNVEFPSDNTNVSPEERLSWFKKADKKHLMDKEDYSFWQDLKDVVTVYRGCRNEEEGLGMSWTLDKNKAVWFATRLARETDSPVVYTCDIEKEHIFAYFSDRNESEVVIDVSAICKHNLVTEKQ